MPRFGRKLIRKKLDNMEQIDTSPAIRHPIKVLTSDTYLFQPTSGNIENSIAIVQIDATISFA